MSVGLMFAWIGLLALNVLSVAGPLFAGRCLADRERALEDEVVAEVEARALAMLAGLATLAQTPAQTPAQSPAQTPAQLR